jgi:tetratricopeptide (TPR) repeat protein
MSLSVVIINRNNEKTIKQCYQSVETLSENIHLIDIKSVDNSHKIISDVNLHLISSDFALSNCLNQIISESKDDYFLYLYAYEVIEASSIANLTELIEKKTDDISGYIFPILKNYSGSDTTNHYSYSCRLFKNEEMYKFKQENYLDISESILSNDKKLQTTSILLISYRYDINKKKLKELFENELAYHLKHNDESNRYYYELAKLLLCCKKYKNVIEVLKQIHITKINDNGFLASIYNMMAATLIEQGILMPASQLLVKSLDLIYHQNYAHILLSQTYYRQKRFTEASSILEIFLGNHGLSPIINYYQHDEVYDIKEYKHLPYVLDDISVNSDSMKVILGTYIITEGRLDDGITILNDVLQKESLSDSDKYRAYSYLRTAYKNQNNQSKVFESLNAMILFDSEKNRKRQLFEDLKEMTLLCVNEEKNDDLSKYVQIGIQNFQYSIFYRYFRAFIYFKQEKYTHVINELDLILENYQKRTHKDISLFDIYLLKANSYYERKLYSKASEHYKNAYRYDQTKIDILYRIGKCLELLEEKDAAVKIYQRVLKIDDKHTAAKADLEQIVR